MRSKQHVRLSVDYVNKPPKANSNLTNIRQFRLDEHIFLVNRTVTVCFEKLSIIIIIIFKKNFLWRSIVKYVLNLSTDNNWWMLGMFFHGCNENLLVFVFCCFSRCCCYCCCCCCFLLAFKSKMPAIKSILTPLWVWMQIRKIDEQRASQILKRKISFPKWRNSQYTRLTWVNKTKCRRMSTLTSVRGVIITSGVYECS